MSAKTAPTLENQQSVHAIFISTTSSSASGEPSRAGHSGSLPARFEEIGREKGHLKRRRLSFVA